MSQQLELNLVAEINRLHSELCGLAWTSLEKAIRIGELLTQQKAKLKHGEWLPWVKENIAFNGDQAARYMRVFANRENPSLKTDLTLTEAYRLLSQPAEEPECETPPAEQPKFNSTFDQEPPRAEMPARHTQIASPPQSSTVTLAPTAPTPTSQEPPKPKRNATCISLDEFQVLTAKAKIERIAIRPEFKALFNYQDNNNIEWARWSWNPVTGCNHGCDYCYARDIAERFTGDAFPFGFAPAIYPERLVAPSQTKQRDSNEWSEVDRLGHRNVFTCSMADLFGKWVPSVWIEAVLEQARANPQWNFLFLSKFPQRMQDFEFPKNAWVGTSVDKQGAVTRAERAFGKIKAEVKWLSCEPMLERLTFNSLEMFDWVVIGGSSRSSKTPEFHPPFEWITHLCAQAQSAKAKVYMKSNLFGDATRVREYPAIW